MQHRPRLDRDQGFALMELAVVVLILAVLAAIAISTYIAQRDKAEDASAVSTLHNLRLAAESIRADSHPAVYAADPRAYEGEQRSYDYIEGDESSDAANEVSVLGGEEAEQGSWVSFAVRGGDGCYYLRLEEQRHSVLRDHRPADEEAGCVASDFAFGEPPAGESWD